MTIFLTLLLTVAAFAVATYPLFKRNISLAAGSTEDENLEELQSRRDTTYSMLKELEFDYQSGILSKEDFEELRERYKWKAVTILKDMDGLQEGPDASDEIEKKVLALRQRDVSQSRDVGVSGEIEEMVLSLRRNKRQFCSQCGARHNVADLFCSRCGTKILKEE
ncbi:MAG: hypothetical protein Q8O55_09065 [Dehalococcoidales bacterium]|nr:hypothetical protein [Dehalococcoidales bacterium]